MARSSEYKKNSNNRRVNFHRRVKTYLADQQKNVRKRYNNINNEYKPKNVFESEPRKGENLSQYASVDMLRAWALKHNITRNAICELLTILIALGMNWLPKDARTLLSTPTSSETAVVANGVMWYNGIENNLRRIFRSINTELTLKLNINIDGIPLFKAARKEFWPILVNLHGENLNCKFAQSVCSDVLIKSRVIS